VSDIVPSMTPDEFTVSVRIRHPSIDPGEITSTLGLEPQHSWQAGDARRTAQGLPLEGTYRETYWTAEFRELDAGLRGVVASETVLLQAVVQLRRLQPFLARLQADGGTIELFVQVIGSTEFRFALSPELLSMISRIGVSLVLDVRTESQLTAQRKAG
jgi:hypothetical protein